MRTYRRERYTLVQVEHPVTDGRAYRVAAPDGTPLGLVATYAAAMERRSRGRRYVNARRYSERWYAQDAAGKSYFHAYETPGKAAEALLRYRD